MCWRRGGELFDLNTSHSDVISCNWSVRPPSFLYYNVMYNQGRFEEKNPRVHWHQHNTGKYVVNERVHIIQIVTDVEVTIIQIVTSAEVTIENCFPEVWEILLDAERGGQYFPNTKRKTVIWICQSSGSNCCLEKSN